MLVYNQICNKYASLAREAFESYMAVKTKCSSWEWPEDSLSAPLSTELVVQYRDQMLSKALSAVVFQALAIEAYINLFGVSELGNEVFFTEIEPPKDKKGNFKYFSTTEKLREICRRSNNCTEYPEHHIQLIDKLLKKRDNLVHMKPRAYELSIKPYNYEHPEENYREYIDMHEEMSFVDSNLDQEMQLYTQLQEMIRKVRGAKRELTEEQNHEIFNALSDAVQDVLMINKDEREK